MTLEELPPDITAAYIQYVLPGPARPVKLLSDAPGRTALRAGRASLGGQGPSMTLT